MSDKHDAATGGSTNDNDDVVVVATTSTEYRKQNTKKRTLAARTIESREIIVIDSDSEAEAQDLSSHSDENDSMRNTVEDDEKLARTLQMEEDEFVWKQIERDEKLARALVQDAEVMTLPSQLAGAS